MSRPVLVVGGGIAGLAAAFDLAQAGRDFVLLEASDRLGGKIAASPVDASGLGFEVDEAADGFLARVPDAVELCREVGLGGDLVAPATSRAFIWSRDELRPIPSPSVLGVPIHSDSLAASGIVGPAGVADFAARMQADLPPLSGDAALGEVLRPRVGDEVFERLVDPLLGGINAGSAEELSIEAGAAALAQAARLGGPFRDALLAGTRDPAKPPAAGRSPEPEHSSPGARPCSAERRPAAAGLLEAGGRHSEAGGRHSVAGAAANGGDGPNGDSTAVPVFNGIRGGTCRLVQALAERLGDRVRLGETVSAVRATGGDWQVVTEDSVVDASGVVLAVPGWVAAGLLGPHAPQGAPALAALDYSDVALATFVIDRAAVDHPLNGSGFLVPRSEGLLMTACSWASSKWAHLDDGAHAVLRVSAGRSVDRRWLDLEPAALTAELTAELQRTIGMHGEPAVRLSAWRRSLPQYRPGHLERCDQLDAELEANAPGLAVCGAATRGLGLPACIRGGRSAARRLLG